LTKIKIQQSGGSGQIFPLFFSRSVIGNNIGNAKFSMEYFSQALGIGRTVFYKKLKGITGYSLNE